MQHSSTIRAILALVTALIANPAHVIAGDLDPPPGPVGPTMKTLTQVEPRTPVETLSGSASALYVIDQSGSYYLTGNITGEPGKHGIFIGADNVTLDLNGFVLQGVPGSFVGVAAFPPGVGNRWNITVLNGAVSNWAGSGLSLSDVTNTRMENIRAWNNAEDGIIVGHHGVSVDCLAIGNGDTGLGGQGIQFIRCVARENGGLGISDNGAQDGGVVRDCKAVANGLDGIRVKANHLVIGNVCSGNGTGGDGAGIGVIQSGNRIEGNNVTNNVCGIDVDSGGNIIIRNTASGNTTNYDITAGNAYGQIIDVAGVGSFASSDPWANFEF